MSLYISSLNSGSNGNCYYIGNQHEAVLIDAGISCRETERRLSRSGLNFNKIKAVFVTHEHTDHTRGVEFIARRFQVPVYISPATHSNSRLRIADNLLNYFNPSTPVHIGGLIVNAFPKRHDASEPHSFTVTGNNITVGVFTDIGSVCEHVKENFNKCHAAFLETNYDEQMLDNGRYPDYLKKRIRGDYGHLSNVQALDLFIKHKSVSMSHLLLSHLSQDNNNPLLVESLFRAFAGGTHVVVASRHRESLVYQITGEGVEQRSAKDSYPSKYIQSSLF